MPSFSYQAQTQSGREDNQRQKQLRNVTKTEKRPITPQLCVSDLTVSQCQHISDPKLTRQTQLTPSLTVGHDWMNGNSKSWLRNYTMRKPSWWRNEAHLGWKRYWRRNAAWLRSQEGKERGRHCGSNTKKDGRCFGSEGREGRDEGDIGDLEWTLPPQVNHKSPWKTQCLIPCGVQRYTQLRN